MAEEKVCLNSPDFSVWAKSQMKLSNAHIGCGEEDYSQFKIRLLFSLLWSIRASI